MKLKLAIALLTILSLNANAAEKEIIESPFKASAELGALYKTGNNRSADILAGFDANYEKDLWRAKLDFNLLVKQTEVANENNSTDLKTTQQKWNIDLQGNRTLDEKSKNYIYGNGFYEDDRFNSFERQWSISSGWGRRWYKSKDSTFDADFGPGFKRDVISGIDGAADETRDSFIIQAQATYTRKLNKHVEFKQFAVAKWATKSDENSTLRAETSVVTKLIETLQLKFSFKLDHNTEVDAGRKKTQTQTGITLVYSF